VAVKNRCVLIDGLVKSHL